MKSLASTGLAKAWLEGESGLCSWLCSGSLSALGVGPVEDFPVLGLWPFSLTRDRKKGSALCLLAVSHRVGAARGASILNL